jgi:hypothetical protein
MNLQIDVFPIEGMTGERKPLSHDEVLARDVARLRALLAERSETRKKEQTILSRIRQNERLTRACIEDLEKAKSDYMNCIGRQEEDLSLEIVQGHEKRLALLRQQAARLKKDGALQNEDARFSKSEDLRRAKDAVWLSLSAKLANEAESIEELIDAWAANQMASGLHFGQFVERVVTVPKNPAARAQELLSQHVNLTDENED